MRSGLTPLLLLALASVALGLTPGSLAPLPKITPVSENDLKQAITSGVDFLIETQNSDGSWGSARRTKGINIYAPDPDSHLAFRSATSGLALSGILNSGDRRPETIKAINAAESWLVAKLPKLRLLEPTVAYNVWGHSYGLRALADLALYHRDDPEKIAELKRLGKQQLTLLLKVETINGGWGYYDFQNHTAHFSGTTTSFTSATALLAMKEAEKHLGLKLPDREIERALASIERQRTPDWSFLYSEGHRYRPRYSINRPAGSLARSQACLAALRKFGDDRVTDDLIAHWLHRLCLREGWLDIGRKRPLPHETHFAISGYFYYYGFYYASECLQFLPPDRQENYRSHLIQHLVTKQERDGSWWDFPLYNYHQPYGTGFALTTLSRLNR